MAVDKSYCNNKYRQHTAYVAVHGTGQNFTQNELVFTGNLCLCLYHFALTDLLQRRFRQEWMMKPALCRLMTDEPMEA